MTTPTDILADHAIGLDIANVPDAVVLQAKRVLFDTISVLFSASRQDAMRQALKTFPLGDGGCTVVGVGRGAAPDRAAFVNGIGGHDTELDDTHAPGRNHTASVIIPSALAAAEATEKSSGASVLAALIAAYDVQIRISKAMGPQRQFVRGFHPTAVCGAVGSAVAAGRIFGLNREQMRSALSLAASQASGLRIYRTEKTHLHKSFQTGMAARNGLYAALLAADGYPGATDPLTAQYEMLTPFGGPDPDYGQLTDALHERYEICETSIKRHACCGQAHAAIDAFLMLRDEHGITPEAIEQIEVELAHDAVPVIDNVPLWTHNCQHIFAVVANEGYIARKHFQPAWTGDPAIRELATRVTLRGSDELQSVFPAKKGAIVHVTTTGGSFTQKVAAPRGNPRDPFSEEEMEQKFRAMAGHALDPLMVTKLWSMRADFEALPDLDGLYAILATTD
jgi:2-methylcitrate dehydratase PrpD